MKSYLLNTYQKQDVEIVKGAGAWVWDSDGRRYLDFLGGVAVLALGHCHPAMVEALTRQAGVLWHASNLVRTREQEQVARRLVEATFADALFFNSSGSEAVDLSLKLVRRYFKGTSRPERWRTITCSGGFHGRTMAGIAAGGQAKLKQGFEPLVDGFDQVPFGDLAAAEMAISPETAAILLEPVQGDGGINVAQGAYLRGLRGLADEHGLLLVLDEVQTGMGRTGKLLAHEWSGVVPDIVAVAKGLGAGFPIGAVLTTQEVAASLSPGSHGATLGGAPLAMAVANAVLDVILADGFLDRVVAVGDRLMVGLKRIAAENTSLFSEPLGIGLMIGLKCKIDNRTVMDMLRREGLLVAPAASNVIRILPPLIISNEEVDEGLEIIKRVSRLSHC